MYPMIWEKKYFLDYDFSRATELFKILDDRTPLTEFVIIELKIKYAIKHGNTNQKLTTPRIVILNNTNQ